MLFLQLSFLKPEKITLASTPVNDDPDSDGDVVYNWNSISITDSCKYELYIWIQILTLLRYTSRFSPASTNTSYDAAGDGKSTLISGNLLLEDKSNLEL